MVRVLYLTPWFPRHPQEQSGNFILDSIEAMQGFGHEVKVVITQPWRPRFARYLNPDWRPIVIDTEAYPPSLRPKSVYHLSIPRNFFRSISNRLYRYTVTPVLRKAVAIFKPDLIHAHNELPAYAALCATSDGALPTIATLHGIDIQTRLQSKNYRSFQRTVLTEVDRVILVGEPLRAPYANLAGRSDHFRVVPNGFRLPPAGAGRLRAERQMCDSLRLISVSNLHEGKGIDLNLKALASLRRSENLAWRYMVVGEGRERGPLEILAAELGIDDRVRFVGACEHDEVYNHLLEADIFVLPSYREAFGIAYLEAMACGLLTIGVDGQGPSAFIHHGETGLLVPPHDAEALTRCLKKALESPIWMQSIAAAGRRHVLNEYSWQRHAERLTAVYRELVPG